MKWIVITLPDFIENESTYINQLFKAGIDLLHLRKPESNIEECKRLIQEIDKKWHKKIVVHDHFELCQEFHLHGIHLNRRNHEIPEGFQGSISQSCHSFKEVEQALQTISPKNKDEKSAILKPVCHYVFLSPIFDSISKKGYKHSFSNKDLEEAGINGIINERVVALGGVTPEYIPQLRAWNFGGAAFLGDVWNRRTDAKWTEYLAVIKQKLAHGNVQNTLNSSNIW